MDQRVNLGREQFVQVGENLRGGDAMALARIAQLVGENGAEDRRLRGEDVCFLLQLQALDEMAERREARRDEGGRGGGGAGDADALEDGSLAVFRDSVVFDARLEGAEEGQARLDVCRRLLEGLEQIRRLFLHGGREVGPGGGKWSCNVSSGGGGNVL